MPMSRSPSTNKVSEVPELALTEEATENIVQAIAFNIVKNPYSQDHENLLQMFLSKVIKIPPTSEENLNFIQYDHALRIPQARLALFKFVKDILDKSESLQNVPEDHSSDDSGHTTEDEGIEGDQKEETDVVDQDGKNTVADEQLFTNLKEAINMIGSIVKRRVDNRIAGRKESLLKSISQYDTSLNIQPIQECIDKIECSLQSSRDYVFNLPGDELQNLIKICLNNFNYVFQGDIGSLKGVNNLNGINDVCEKKYSQIDEDQRKIMEEQEKATINYQARVSKAIAKPINKKTQTRLTPIQIDYETKIIECRRIFLSFLKDLSFLKENWQTQTPNLLHEIKQVITIVTEAIVTMQEGKEFDTDSIKASLDRNGILKCIKDIKTLWQSAASCDNNFTEEDLENIKQKHLRRFCSEFEEYAEKLKKDVEKNVEKPLQKDSNLNEFFINKMQEVSSALESIQGEGTVSVKLDEEIAEKHIKQVQQQILAKSGTTTTTTSSSSSSHDGANGQEQQDEETVTRKGSFVNQNDQVKIAGYKLDPNITDNLGNTLLHYAIQNGIRPYISALLTHGAALNKVNNENGHGRTVLEVMTPRTLAMFIEPGNDTPVVSSKKGKEKSKSTTSVVKKPQKSDPNYLQGAKGIAVQKNVLLLQDKTENTPLHWMVINGNLESVNHILALAIIRVKIEYLNKLVEFKNNNKLSKAVAGLKKSKSKSIEKDLQAVNINRTKIKNNQAILKEDLDKIKTNQAILKDLDKIKTNLAILNELMESEQVIKDKYINVLSKVKNNKSLVDRLTASENESTILSDLKAIENNQEISHEVDTIKRNLTILNNLRGIKTHSDFFLEELLQAKNDKGLTPLQVTDDKGNNIFHLVASRICHAPDERFMSQEELIKFMVELAEKDCVTEHGADLYLIFKLPGMGHYKQYEGSYLWLKDEQKLYYVRQNNLEEVIIKNMEAFKKVLKIDDKRRLTVQEIEKYIEQNKDKIPKSEHDLYVMLELPDVTRYEQYEDSYIWLKNKQELYYIQEKKPEKIKINNINTFKKVLKLKQHLTVNEVNKYIKLNGGHTRDYEKTYSLSKVKETLLKENKEGKNPITISAETNSDEKKQLSLAEKRTQVALNGFLKVLNHLYAEIEKNRKGKQFEILMNKLQAVQAGLHKIYDNSEAIDDVLSELKASDVIDKRRGTFDVRARGTSATVTLINQIQIELQDIEVMKENNRKFAANESQLHCAVKDLEVARVAAITNEIVDQDSGMKPAMLFKKDATGMTPFEAAMHPANFCHKKRMCHIEAQKLIDEAFGLITAHLNFEINTYSKDNKKYKLLQIKNQLITDAKERILKNENPLERLRFELKSLVNNEKINEKRHAWHFWKEDSRTLELLKGSRTHYITAEEVIDESFKLIIDYFTQEMKKYHPGHKKHQQLKQKKESVQAAQMRAKQGQSPKKCALDELKTLLEDEKEAAGCSCYPFWKEESKKIKLIQQSYDTIDSLQNSTSEQLRAR